jgi:hypothetical protein
MKQSWKSLDGCAGHLEAIDVSGRIPSPIRLRSNHARRDLLEFLGKKHADKMMVDNPDGSHHIGYVIAGHWFRIVLVIPVERCYP